MVGAFPGRVVIEIPCRAQTGQAYHGRNAHPQEPQHRFLFGFDGAHSCLTEKGSGVEIRKRLPTPFFHFLSVGSSMRMSVHCCVRSWPKCTSMVVSPFVRLAKPAS